MKDKEKKSESSDEKKKAKAAEPETIEEAQADAEAEKAADAIESDAAKDAKTEDDAAALEAKAEEPKEDADARYMRLAADFQNYKRRVEKEKSDIYQFANEKIAIDIVEVMDNFERALAHMEDCEDKKFAEGVDLIYKQLKGVLDKNNIIEIPAENQPFDPNFHNAVMTEENPDFESGVVIEAFQKGYTLNNKVIRPSMVKVSQ